jgi:hypothetical protein
MKRLASFAAVALIACGGTDSTSPITTLNATATVTLSGAQTGTFTSKNMAAVFGTSDQRGGFSFNVTQAAGTPAIVVAIRFTGEPKVGHFKSTDVGAQAGLSVSPNSPVFWIATDGNVSSPAGSYDLNLTSVATSSTVSTGKTYNVSGTLDAVLPAVAGSGATGTVTLHATF